jgi:hemerythrin-like domain-containing protein
VQDEVDRASSGGAPLPLSALRRFLTFLEHDLEAHAGSEEHSVYAPMRGRLDFPHPVLTRCDQEHQALRLAMQALRTDLIAAPHGSLQLRAQLVRRVIEVIGLVRTHMAREETALFPLAEEILGPRLVHPQPGADRAGRVEAGHDAARPAGR